MIEPLFEDMILTPSHITTPDQQDIKYINCVPKIQSTAFMNLSTSKSLLLVPLDELSSIRSMQSNTQALNYSKRLFYINPYYMSTLINDIIKTNGKYVYPMVFVNYLKQTLAINEKVNFNNELLLHLRIWSNQIRELSNKHNIAEYKFSHEYVTDNMPDECMPSHVDIMRNITYIGYRICCELMFYYKYVHKR